MVVGLVLCGFCLLFWFGDLSACCCFIVLICWLFCCWFMLMCWLPVNSVVLICRGNHFAFMVCGF